MNHLRLELKVCEGCGALWLRAETASGVHCTRCIRTLREFPPVRKRRTTPSGVSAQHATSGRIRNRACAGGAR